MAVTEFDAAIFFDNDQGYLDDVKSKCPKITLVKVNETYPLKKSLLNSGPLSEFIDTLGPNSYVDFLKAYKDWIPSYDPESGIQEAHVEKYYEWAKTTTGNRILLLDWDLTMVMFDGMELPSYDDIHYNFFSQALISPKDVAIFYFGGKERYTMIKKWLIDIAKSGVHIGILTNNGGCHERLFQQIVAEMVPKGSYEMMCSRFAPHNSNKGKFLADDPRFARLCVQAGGKRKRQSLKRVNTKQRKSRKHRK
jgi:hypothetical protein